MQEARTKFEELAGSLGRPFSPVAHLLVIGASQVEADRLEHQICFARPSVADGAGEPREPLTDIHHVDGSSGIASSCARSDEIVRTMSSCWSRS